MLIDMTKDEKNNYLRDVDLNVTDFEIKIADFGLAKQLTDKSEKMN